jgi:acyl-coenzyme A thioesterase PaaI-like protein
VLSDFGRGFDSELGLTYQELTPDGARAQLEIHDRLLQPWGIVHGGVYCSVVGVNNNTDFLRAIGSGTVYGTATPVHRGRRQQLWIVTIADSGDRLVARGQVRLQNLDTPPN